MTLFLPCLSQLNRRYNLPNHWQRGLVPWFELSLLCLGRTSKAIIFIARGFMREMSWVMDFQPGSHIPISTSFLSDFRVPLSGLNTLKMGHWWREVVNCLNWRCFSAHNNYQSPLPYQTSINDCGSDRVLPCVCLSLWCFKTWILLSWLVSNAQMIFTIFSLPVIHLGLSPQILHFALSSNSLGTTDCNAQWQIENNYYAKFWEINKV